jgi:hypothetical protein
MAEINVKDLRIRHGSEQLASEPVNVTVVVNNQETFGGGADGCESSDGFAGHRAKVTVEAIHAGEVVESQAREVCAPVQGASLLRTSDPEMSFSLDLSAGNFVIRATTEGVNTGQADTEEVSIIVEEEASAPPAEDGSGDDGSNDGGTDDEGLPPFGDTDNDGHRNFVDPEPHNPEVPSGGGPLNIGGQTDKLLLVVGMIALAWAADSGAEVVG